MKKINIKDAPEKYITTLKAKEITGLEKLPKTLQKYSMYGSRKTYYHIDDVNALKAETKEEETPQPKENAEPSQQQEEAYEELVLEAYVDGSFNQEKGIYGSAVIMVNDDKVLTMKTTCGSTMNKMRNVAGEICAAALAVRMAEELIPDSLVIKYDYEGIEKWATGAWKAKNEYTSQYAAFMNRERSFPITFEHVKAHTGNMYNELADDMALRAVGLKPDYDTVSAAPKEKKISEDILIIKYEVKKSCMDGIKEFYSKEKHAFKDYLKLRTGTGDNFSRCWCEDAFTGIVSEDTKMYIKDNLTDNNLILGAMRWVARGLDPYDAVKKVKVDEEVYNKKNK